MNVLKARIEILRLATEIVQRPAPIKTDDSPEIDLILDIDDILSVAHELAGFVFEGGCGACDDAGDVDFAEIESDEEAL